MITARDLEWMELAMRLAQKGEGWVNPNPMVGALIVRDDQQLACGYHHRHGDLHAERDAFSHADRDGIDCTGATMYVTLEPCCHHGHQPPCTDAIIEHHIGRVVVGLDDPNPLVAGHGLQILRQAGITVEVIDDLSMRQKLRYQNRVFLHYITTHRPWVTAKWAMTLDGKIATHTGSSQWITSPEARRRVHFIRRRHVAILTGIGTALADDPMLNVRLTADEIREAGFDNLDIRQPIRIVIDRHARLPLDSRLATSAHTIPVILAHGAEAPAEKLRQLSSLGITLWPVSSLHDVIERCGQEHIDSLFTECGGTLMEALFREGLVNEVLAFVGPKIVGGREALTPVEGEGIAQMVNAITLSQLQVEQIGPDLLISGLTNQQ